MPDAGTAVLVRLLMAMLFGGLVAAIYRLTRSADETAPRSLSRSCSCRS